MTKYTEQPTSDARQVRVDGTGGRTPRATNQPLHAAKMSASNRWTLRLAQVLAIGGVGVLGTIGLSPTASATTGDDVDIIVEPPDWSPDDGWCTPGVPEDPDCDMPGAPPGGEGIPCLDPALPCNPGFPAPQPPSPGGDDEGLFVCKVKVRDEGSVVFLRIETPRECGTNGSSLFETIIGPKVDFVRTSPPLGKKRCGVGLAPVADPANGNRDTVEILYTATADVNGDPVVIVGFDEGRCVRGEPQRKADGYLNYVVNL